jgi:RNA polymerase sigma factor (sigma-70 family)
MDRLSFLRIVAKEYDYLIAAAKKVQLDPPKDAVQDVIATVLANEAYRELDPQKGSIRGFLYQCVKNRALNLKRREAFESNLFFPLEEITTDSDRPTKGDLCSRQNLELEADVAAAIAKLTPLERAVAEKIYMGNESYFSLAEYLGVLESEVHEAGRRVREKLRVALADYAPQQVGNLLAKAG